MGSRRGANTPEGPSPEVQEGPSEALGRARFLLAAGLAGGDASGAGIARFAGVDLAEATSALATCREHGLIEPDGSVDTATSALLVADLPVEAAAEIHARAARYWMSVGPEHLLAALQQMRAAGTLLALDEMVEMAERSGRMSLSLHDYSSAAELLKLAVDLDPAGNLSAMGWRLCEYAAALDGLGQVADARDCYVRAAALGESAGDAALVARAAVGCALPVDWYAGETRALALLARAETMDLSPDDRTKVTAARGLVEMRIPLSHGSDLPEHQFAWVTRPSVAHALTEEALVASEHQSPDTRALALLAWRTTHRSPAVLARRREISKAALDHAQVIRQPSHQVEAAVWLAADALESGDRGLFDEALSVARWVGERDTNPRLVWRAHTLSCGAAFLDGDIDRALSWQERAREVGMATSIPGWLGGDLLFLGERVLESSDEALLKAHLFDEDFPALVNPVGRAAAALVHARVGDPQVAMRMVRRSLRQLDIESSYLLLATRCAAVAEQLGDADLATEIIGVLEPWSSHVAVDSNAWWCDGPVSRWLASLWMVLGDTARAATCVATALPVARALNDARSLSALARLQGMLGDAVSVAEAKRSTGLGGLTARQERILGLMADGFTNREIGDQLSFSASTVRVETMAIYRTLGVKSRAEAVAKAMATGLLRGAD